jgi:hypothetical protein
LLSKYILSKKKKFSSILAMLIWLWSKVIHWAKPSTLTLFTDVK